MSGEDFGGGVFERAWLRGGRASNPEGGADIDDFDLAGAFDHDVGGFEVAVDQAAAVESGDSFEAFAEDGDGHAGFEAAVDFTGGDHAFVNAGPAAFRDGILDDFEAVTAEDMEQVEAVDPFHFEHINALVELEGMHVDEVVDLNAGHKCSDLGHAVHFEVVMLGGVEGGGREEFEGNWDFEGGSAAAFSEHHAALTACSESFEECAFRRPLDTWPLKQRRVALLQSGDRVAGDWGIGG